jgi:hypothetical protein
MPTIKNNSLIVPKKMQYREKYDPKVQETFFYHILPGTYPIQMAWTTAYVHAEIMVEDGTTHTGTVTNLAVPLYEVMCSSVHQEA